jgi:short subunit dehydrogenase-like uncharacterized protein
MQAAPAQRTILVYGAYGHTGRFIVPELIAQGFVPVLSGRDRVRLEALAACHPTLEVRPASLDDRAALDRAFDGVAAVINAAGPFAFTAARLIDAALRAGVPYLDVAAEADVVAATMASHGERAQRAGIAVVPAMAFYGGLGDLLATAAMGDWPDADEITLAYALSSWKPSVGTRLTIEANGKRREGRRLVFSDGRLELRSDDAPSTQWAFPAPVGTRPVVAEFTTADSVTMSRHLKFAALTELMTSAALKDLGGGELSPAQAVDSRGRSAQTFLLEAVVRRGDAQRRAVATGQDIYAVTAPLVVEALRRLLAQPAAWRGILTAGELGDARGFLQALSVHDLDVAFD